MRTGRRVVVMGILGRRPLAGVARQVLHYLEGLRRLGHEAYYVEDTGTWPYDPRRNAVTADPSYTVRYIGQLMAWCGLADRWAYRAPSRRGRTFGLSASQLARLWERADLLVNLTGSTELRDEHLRVPVRIYLETDPVLPQIEVAAGCRYTIKFLAAHTHHFTYAENLGAPDCGVPLGRFRYRPTRQPVVLDWWRRPSRADGLRPRPFFTTIASWRQWGPDVEWRGEAYTWSKHHEFLKFADLPRRSGRRLELALAWHGRLAPDGRRWIRPISTPTPTSTCIGRSPCAVSCSGWPSGLACHCGTTTPASGTAAPFTGRRERGSRFPTRSALELWSGCWDSKEPAGAPRTHRPSSIEGTLR